MCENMASFMFCDDLRDSSIEQSGRFFIIIVITIDNLYF
jgi:hypothetical protein